MPEAFADKHQDSLSLMEAAEKLSVNVISNSPLLSGSLINVPLSTKNLKCDFNGAKHLQLIRSVPSLSLISTLVGQKQNRHVRTNLQVLSVPPLNED